MSKLTKLNELVTVEQANSDQNPAIVYLASLAPGSRRTMTQALETIATIAGFDHLSMPWGALRYQHTQAIRSHLAERYTASTANKMLSALRGVLKDAWRLGQMDAESYQRAVDIKSVTGSNASQAETGRHLTSGELLALITVCMDGSKLGVRDAAIIAVGYACGLRRAELANLQLSDFDGESLTIRGKGNKTRIVPITNGALDALMDWLTVRGDWEGALFVRIRKGDHMAETGLTDQAIYNILIKRAEQAGVKSFSPHDLRRTFAGDLMDTGTDISTVQKLMGHASVATTAGYDRRDAKAKRKAVSSLHVPYQRQFYNKGLPVLGSSF